ncbi:MAG TPA: aldose epimerase family protein [Caproiciproducens sp.]|nr:aldose epimerase family protein [Caproiciproducens sp.]
MKLTNITSSSPDYCRNLPIYCMENNTMSFGTMAFGAAVAFVRTPDRRGNIKNIALSLPDRNAYSASDTYAGATVGPVAGRIKGGILSIHGKEYRLLKNDGENTLHGGPENLGHSLWKVQETFCSENEAGVVFTQHLHDGQNGFPGERDISVRYSLSDDNTIQIRYTAVTDKETWVNPTNHSYWNLSGDFTGPGDFQVLQINAESVYYNDRFHLPVSCENVKGTPFDFTAPRAVGDAVQSNPSHPQLLNALGYNNAYLLNQGGGPAAVLYDPFSGRRVTVTTDYPSLVFYSGGYLGNAGCTADSQKIAAGSAYALEAQYLPDAPRLQGGRTPFLKPGEVFQKSIAFRFDLIP